MHYLVYFHKQYLYTFILYMLHIQLKCRYWCYCADVFTISKFVKNLIAISISVCRYSLYKEQRIIDLINTIHFYDFTNFIGILVLIVYNFLFKVQEGLLIALVTWRQSVVMQQYELPASLQFSAVAFRSRRLTSFHEFVKKHTIHVPLDTHRYMRTFLLCFGVDVLGCTGSTHDF